MSTLVKKFLASKEAPRASEEEAKKAIDWLEKNFLNRPVGETWEIVAKSGNKSPKPDYIWHEQKRASAVNRRRFFDVCARFCAWISLETADKKVFQCKEEGEIIERVERRERTLETMLRKLT